MSRWRSIKTAPKDGTPFQAEIPGYGSDYVVAWIGGYYDSDDRTCGGWTIVEDQEPPDCWTDGVCWRVNDGGVPSTQPSRWKPLPTTEPTP